MKKQQPLEYEEKCKFIFRDSEKPGEYTIYADRIETTCRRCGVMHQVGAKFEARARLNHDILENALCLNCFIEEKEIEKGVEADLKHEKYMDKDITIRVGMVSNQTAQHLAQLSVAGKLKSEAEASDAYDHWFAFYWDKVNEKLEEKNG